MQWIIGIIGALASYIFFLKKKDDADAGVIGNINTSAKVKPIQQQVDANNSTINADNATLKQEEKKVDNESLQDLSKYFNTNLKS